MASTVVALSVKPLSPLPDRNDYLRYDADLSGRIRAWGTAVAASRQLADELQEWLLRPDMGRVEAI